jgi:HK97 family phage portal protein
MARLGAGLMRSVSAWLAGRTLTPPLAPSGTSGGGWQPVVIHEPYAGAWQSNIETPLTDVLTYPTIYACVTLIASDIAKMRLRLGERDAQGIWREINSPAFSPVLRAPNRHQTPIKFFEQWVLSKLVWGNTYVLKLRDLRGIVNRLIILDPQRVRPQIAPDGQVLYELDSDYFAGLTEEAPVQIPGEELIHDVMVPLYHPLVGVSPLYACGLAAMQGLRIQTNSANFFANQSRPSGILHFPAETTQESVDRAKAKWQESYSGANYGKTAVLTAGGTFTPITVNATDAELVNQLKWTAEAICSCFHIPPYMVGAGPAPTYNNIEALNQQYYAQCLQSLIASIEQLLDVGLELPTGYATAFDLDDLLRMDTATMYEAEKDAVGAGIKAPNEARRRLNLPPVEGGASPYLQQQNYSLEALARRDAAALTPAPPPAPAAEDDLTTHLLAAVMRKDFRVIPGGQHAA